MLKKHRFYNIYVFIQQWWFLVANEYRLSTVEERKQEDRKGSTEPEVYNKTYNTQWESVQGKKQEIGRWEKKEEIEM